jgi:formate dehydrogenase major subunit
MNYWSNTPKFHVSLMKAWWGPAATAENNWAFDYLPKLDKQYDMLQIFEMMTQGKVNGYIAQGFNPLAALANSNSVREGLKKLKFLVIMDPLVTETSSSGRTTANSTTWTRLRSRPRCSACPPPASPKKTVPWSAPRACCSGTGRLPSPRRGQDRHCHHVRSAPAPEGSLPEGRRQVLRAHHQSVLALCRSRSPSSEEVAKEYNGRALVDLFDPKDPTKLIRKAGEQLAGFGEMRDDGTTLGGCWIWAGSWTSSGNQMARRDNSDPTGIGNTLNWAWAWPANRRVLYNRASCDRQGKPFNPNAC